MINTTLLKNSQIWFTTARAWNVIQEIADTHAPSQTVAFSRAIAIQRILDAENVQGFTLIPDYQQTGCTVLYFGERLPKSLVFAHADEISYLVASQDNYDNWPLVPFCKHLSQVEMDAVALRYIPEKRAMVVTAEGSIVPLIKGNTILPRFKIRKGEVRAGDRVVYHHPLRRNDDMITGSIDNAAGVSACLLAAIALSRTAVGAEVGFAFTDEEEGPAEHNTSFSRGARKLLQRIGAPDLCIVVDGHRGPGDGGFGKGALFAGYSGQAASAVTPPHLYAAFTALLAELQKHGIKVQESTGNVSRGDDIAIIEYTNQILLLGYPSSNRHFDQAPPQASLVDLVELAKTIYWTILNLCPNAQY
jgi:hypothetical protein